MRLPESYAEEKWLLFLFQLPQGVDGEVGNAAIKIGVVRHGTAVALGVAAEVGRKFVALGKRWLITAMGGVVQHLRHTPRLRIALNLLSPIMEELTDALREVTVVFEMLR